jgi:multicomponent Na+:H+ antiporter subunit G
MTLAGWIALPFLLAGLFFLVAGTAGLLRFPDPHSRLHALTKADNLGLGLVALGLLPLAGTLAEGLQMMLAWLLVLVASAVASRLMARASEAEGEAGGP